MSDDPRDAIAEAIREAAQLILAGLCAIGEAIHESREEPDAEEVKPPVRECIEADTFPGGGFLCASVTCLDPPTPAFFKVRVTQGEYWYLCAGCTEHVMTHGYEVTVVERKGMPPKPDMTSAVRLRRKAEVS